MIEKYESSWEYDCSSTPEAWTHNCYMLVNFVEGLKLKINQIIETINPILEERESGIKVYEEAHKMFDNKLPDGDDAIQEVIHADPYAEQKKWIGKLCRFKDNDDDKWNYSVLKSIDTDTDFPFWDTEDYEWGMCEPVSPEDDIIYKGGNNDSPTN